MIRVLVVFLFLVSSLVSAKEADYQKAWCTEGRIEHRLDDRTRVDCLTDSHSIEFDYAHKWAEAIGQSLYYAFKTNKRAGIVLIYRSDRDHKYFLRLNSVIEHNKLPIDVWVMNKSHLSDIK